MRAEGEISKEIFKQKTAELETTILKLQTDIAELEVVKPEAEITDYAEKLTVLQYALEQYTNWDDNDVPESVIEAFVVKIVASKDGFDWYFRFNGNPDDPLHCTVEGKKKSTTQISVAGGYSPAIHKSDTGRHQGLISNNAVAPGRKTRGFSVFCLARCLAIRERLCYTEQANSEICLKNRRWKNMLKKWLALLLALCMVFSLAACGGDEDDSGKDNDKNNGSGNGGSGAVADFSADLILEGDVPLGTPEKTLDPQQVYANLTYTAPMFYGDYRLLGGEDAAIEMSKKLDTMEMTIDGYDMVLPILPYRFEAGTNNLGHWVTRIDGYEWCRLSYMRDYGDGEYVLSRIFCAYTVEGNQITLNPIDHWQVNEEENEITYEMTDIFFTYEFSFKGRELTLSKDGHSVTMNTGLAPSEDEIFVDAVAYLSGNVALDGIEQLMVGYYRKDNTLVKAYAFGGEISSYGAGKMEANGLLTFTVPWDEATKTYQFVYFYCREDGLVLTDGTNTYYYNHSVYTYMKDDLYSSVPEEDRDKVEDLPQQELEDLVEKKDNLLADLKQAFADAGIQVTVDERTGELAMDTSILFGGNSAELTEEGKAFLDAFIGVYASIVNNEKYAGFVAKTVVEGHTAKLADSTYESGLPLSTERADVVKDYCANAETSLAATLEAVGMSCSKPIYNADGSVNLEASRRVAFKFIISLDDK